MRKPFLFLSLLTLLFAERSDAQKLWHGIQRTVHYKPAGEDFVLVKGGRRFNRALYGGNTAFRAEAGDLPEFALYLPGMGGNLKFGLIRGAESKWLITADSIETRYRPGSMIYTIRDRLLGKGTLVLTALATYDREALVVKLEGRNLPPAVELLAVYGGATGTRFSRDGDIGADPESSFDLKAENCRNNHYRIHQNAFTLFYGASALSEEERYEIQYKPAADTTKRIVTAKQITGTFPPGANLRIVDASRQASPSHLLGASDSTTPAIAAKMSIRSSPLHFYLHNGVSATSPADLPAIFEKAEARRKELASRIRVSTPDPFINTIGGALSVAADAVWESPSYLHGAVAWRMRLPGWRGAYLADVLGWHDRARTHFSAYAVSQVTAPAVGPVVMDTVLHLARHAEKMGTSVFSSGYISRNPGGDVRPHHYDMNLVFVDALLNHFLWTGDTAYIRTMWPLLKRHLAWEDRNFDVDGDNLYDAYAAIWASDALQYSGGGVTHSSAYNYKAYQLAAQLAPLVGEDPSPYQNKADAILAAVNSKLWMPEKGVYAEFKDLLGNRLQHPSPAVWTIYHALDSKVADAFQADQSLQYITERIPHIPVVAEGLPDTSLQTISTTNWQPYTWSLNNVVLAEVAHTALAYWQGGRAEEAFQLWKAALVESMYLGASPGNCQQLSFYDAMRGELYRDFADDIGMTARSLVEGLFGVFVDALHDTVHLRPGFPQAWKNASLQTPDIRFSFTQVGLVDRYSIRSNSAKRLALALSVRAKKDQLPNVVVNGKRAPCWFDSTAVGEPRLCLKTSPDKFFDVSIHWRGREVEKPKSQRTATAINLSFQKATLRAVFDPQKALAATGLTKYRLTATTAGSDAKRIYLQVAQGDLSYWLPVQTMAKSKDVVTRTNAQAENVVYKTVDLARYFNDKVTNIFSNQYLSPRPPGPTLQLPTQGIGNWAYPLVQPAINDSGLRSRAGPSNQFTTHDGVPFSTPSKADVKNILFTSQWDNYPREVSLPLVGKAAGVHLLMAGSTNPMQSHLTNGEVIVLYTDGSADTLALKNPQNWWPIEQDYFVDGFAFTTGAPRPRRVYLKSGEDSQEPPHYITIKGFTNYAIDGGAATVLYLLLDSTKTLARLTLRAVANDVVIGLMSVTLVRPKA